jgi:hypothetical protein
MTYTKSIISEVEHKATILKGETGEKKVTILLFMRLNHILIQGLIGKATAHAAAMDPLQLMEPLH